MLQEEEMPEVEIDIDDLLEVNSDDERASKLQVYPCVCVCASAFVSTCLFLGNTIVTYYTMYRRFRSKRKELHQAVILWATKIMTEHNSYILYILESMISIIYRIILTTPRQLF